MPRSGSARPPRRRRALVLRGIGFAVAVALGAVAVWLIVTSDSQKALRIGALTGFWALLIGAFAVFGSRVSHREPGPAAAPAAPASQELDVRKIGEIERAAVAAARREFQAELQSMFEQTLRREVQAGVEAEISELRADVASLRNELLEKVGGQLRLERIETTRLIGSDLEAVQHELRQLRQIGALDPEHRDSILVERLPSVTEPVVPDQPEPADAADVVDTDVVDTDVVDEVAETAADADGVETDRPVSDVVDTDVIEPTLVAPEPEPEPASQAVAPEPEPEPASQAVAPEPQAVAPVTERQPIWADPAPGPDGAPDPFAALPRITPFRDFELEPIGATKTSSGQAAHRHAASDEDEAPRSGGRRHRADDSENDVLARILAREQRF